MAIRTGRLGNVAFKKESTFDTYVAGDIYLRASSESLARKIDTAEDPALVGEIFTTDLIQVGDGYAGSLESAAHGDTIGNIIYGVLGGEAAVDDPVNAFIVMSYNGASAYARLSIVGSNLLAELSSDGSSWSADTNFNTTGTIDLSAAAFDTVAELTTAVAAYTGWDAVSFGLGAALTATIPAFAITNLKAVGAIVGSMLLRCEQTTATLSKMHTVTPALAATSLPSWSFTVNRVLGTNQSLGFSGAKMNSASISVSAKDLMKVSCAVVGATEASAKNDLALTLPTVQAFTAPNVKMVIVDSTGAQIEFTEVKDISLTLNANLDDNKVVGSLVTKEMDRQGATLDLSFTANNTSAQYALRTSYTGMTSCEVFIYAESTTYVDLAKLVKYNMMFRIPSVKFEDFNSPLSTPDRLTIAATGKAMKPQSTIYTKHIYAYICDNDVTTY